MPVGYAIGNPVEKPIEEIGPTMPGSYSAAHLGTNQIGGMLQLGRIIHVPDITCPKCPALHNAQKPVETGIVIETLLGNIRIEPGSYIMYHRNVRSEV
jgi:hypothetical protein